MPGLDTSSKRRSSVGLWSPWQTAPPSPTDSPGVIDADDREHIAGAYSGLVTAMPVLGGVLFGVWGPIAMVAGPLSGREIGVM